VLGEDVDDDLHDLDDDRTYVLRTKRESKTKNSSVSHAVDVIVDDVDLF
jgi:hypothetical protein